MNADGTQPRQLFAAPSTNPGMLIDPRYAPGGTSIAVTMGCCGSYTVYDIALDGKQTSRLLGNAGAHIFLDWNRAGTAALYTANGTLWTAGLEGRDAQPLGGDAPSAGSFVDAHYSPDGSHIVATLVPAAGEEAAENAIVLMHADGRYLTFLTRDLPYDVGTPSWSPDGKSIAFSVGSGTEGPVGKQHDLWIMRYDGSHKQNVTRGRLGSVVDVVWAR
jgi:Tol biopolymer transport system component